VSRVPIVLKFRSWKTPFSLRPPALPWRKTPPLLYHSLVQILQRFLPGPMPCVKRSLRCKRSRLQQMSALVRTVMPASRGARPPPRGPRHPSGALDPSVTRSRRTRDAGGTPSTHRVQCPPKKHQDWEHDLCFGSGCHRISSRAPDVT